MDFARASRRALDVQFSSAVEPRAASASQQLHRRSSFMSSKTGRFQRADRILCSRDFSRAIKSGKRRISESFAVAITRRAEVSIGESPEERTRLGVTVSKRVGNAVVRNRVKRCIREWFRQERAELPRNSDIVVTARPRARDLSSVDITMFLNRMIDDVRNSQGDQKVVSHR